MAKLDIGKKYGTYTIIDNDGEKVYALCSECNHKHEISIAVGEKDIIKILEGHDCDDDIDYNIYEGKYIGSIRIVKYDEENSIAIGICSVCNKTYTLTGHDPAGIISVFRGASCEYEPPFEEEQIKDKEWTVIKNEPLNINYKIDLKQTLQELKDLKQKKEIESIIKELQSENS